MKPQPVAVPPWDDTELKMYMEKQYRKEPISLLITKALEQARLAHEHGSLNYVISNSADNQHLNVTFSVTVPKGDIK